jgi:hypothetical protein
VILAAAPLSALVPAELARRKGRSFVGFYVFGLVFLPFAIATALLVREGTE